MEATGVVPFTIGCDLCFWAIPRQYVRGVLVLPRRVSTENGLMNI